MKIMNTKFLLTSLSILVILGATIQFSFDTNAYAEKNHGHFHSLKEQIDDNLSFNEILCLTNTNHVLVERTNGKLACVYNDTAEKFNWIIQDEDVRENLWLMINPAVKDCIPKGPDDAWTTQPYRNSTHSFDVEFCEWNVRELFYNVVKEDDMIFVISYTIKGGTIDGMGSDDDADSLLMSIDSNADFGEMSVSIPKEFFNYYSDDHIFSMFVLENQEEILRTEIIDEENIFLKFNFTQTDPIIEIIYTFLP